MRVATCLVWLALVAPAEAAPLLPSATRAAPAQVPGWLGSSLVVLAGASLGLALWRRHQRGRAPGGPRLEVVAQVALGGRARALWLRADHRELLVAVAPSSVQVLESWSAPPHAEPAPPPPRARVRSHRRRAPWCRRAPLAAPATPRPRARRSR